MTDLDLIVCATDKSGKVLLASEGGGGLVHLRFEDGASDIFRPAYSLDKARSALHSLYIKRTDDGTEIKDSFCVDGFDYFPSCVSFLYWNFFYNYFRYKKLLDQILRKELTIEKIENNLYGNFKFISGMFGIKTSNRQLRFFKLGSFKNLIWLIIGIRNKLVVRGGERAVLFLRATFDDFRSSNVINELSKSYDVVQVAWPTKSDMVRLFFKKEYFFCCPGFQNNFKKVSISTSSDLIDKVAVDYLNEQVGVRISTQKHFNWCLGNKKFAYLIGMDDCNYAYPIIYACREKLIPTIGIQHTFYCKEHEAYVMSGLSAHPWFDYLLVYGEFWKEKFLQHNKLFDSDNIYIYQNKSQYGSQKNLTREKKNEPPAVLLIYEFLADTIQIGLYVRKLMNLGYKIYFKVRSDEDILEQIKAYNLPINLTSKWIIVQEINEAIMSVVDYVGGTYSTMLFDLYPYGKPIIVFNTEFIFNSDSLQYISRVCNFEDLDNLETLIITESADVVAEKTKQLFGKTPIVEVLNQIDGLR